jgi:hypothetical protein
MCPNKTKPRLKAVTLGSNENSIQIKAFGHINYVLDGAYDKAKCAQIGFCQAV